MAKKATAKGGSSEARKPRKPEGKSQALTRTDSGEGRGSERSEGLNASEAILKLLQSPLVAELITVAATAALAALAEQGFSRAAEDGVKNKRAGKAVKAAGVAAAAAIGRRLSTEFEEIKNAAKGARERAEA